MTETVKLGPQTCEGTAHGQWFVESGVWCVEHGTARMLHGCMGRHLPLKAHVKVDLCAHAESVRHNSLRELVCEREFAVFWTCTGDIKRLGTAELAARGHATAARWA